MIFLFFLLIFFLKTRAALTNNEQENLNQIQADNVTKRSGVCINRKKYTNICFPKQGHLKIFKRPFRDPYLGLDLSLHVNNTPNPSRDSVHLNYFRKRSSYITVQCVHDMSLVAKESSGSILQYSLVRIAVVDGSGSLCLYL
jgi:hypothetical protein